MSRASRSSPAYPNPTSNGTRGPPPTGLLTQTKQSPTGPSLCFAASALLRQRANDHHDRSGRHRDPPTPTDAESTVRVPLPGPFFRGRRSGGPQREVHDYRGRGGHNVSVSVPRARFGRGSGSGGRGDQGFHHPGDGGGGRAGGGNAGVAAVKIQGNISKAGLRAVVSEGVFCAVGVDEDRLVARDRRNCLLVARGGEGPGEGNRRAGCVLADGGSGDLLDVEGDYARDRLFCCCVVPTRVRGEKLRKGWRRWGHIGEEHAQKKGIQEARQTHLNVDGNEVQRLDESIVENQRISCSG